MADKDVEAGKTTQISHLRQVFDQAGITPEVEKWDYPGSGTEDDPYVVNWIDNDPRNPMLYRPAKKWFITALVALATLAVAFVSSAYSGGADEIVREFGCSQEVYTLGISLFVLGFAVGPLLWAPLSEIFGRQILFITTYAGLTAFNAGAAGSQNIWTLIILRFFAGAFGSSPLTNAGGVISDMFSAKQRGLALSFFAAAPFMGPVLGPIVGGFVAETIGWRWVEGVMAIFTGVLWIIGSFFIPETYPAVLLRKRAAELSKMTGKVYRSKNDVQAGPVGFGEVLKTSLARPWILLFREPIVFLLSLYMAIIYGTLYMLFGAFPIVYQEKRGWSAGIGGLAFLGIAVGMLAAVAYAIWDNKRYSRVVDKNDGFAPPEARLPLCMIGSIAIPIGMFWFAWTNYPSVQFMASISAGVPFGFGVVLVFLGVMNFLVDSYTIFAASVLAANAVLRSIFGATFPLFTSQMYDNLGIHWASSIPAFLALVCVPFPFLFYKYGPAIRSRCKFAAESEKFMRQMQKDSGGGDDSDEGDDGEKIEESDYSEKGDRRASQDQQRQASSSVPNAVDVEDEKKKGAEEAEEEEEPVVSPADESAAADSRFQAIRVKSRTQRPDTLVRMKSYESNPFDLDRVHTRESFGRSRQGSRSRASSLASSKSRK